MRNPAPILTGLILFLTGIVSLAIGFSITFLTESFYTSTGVSLQGDPGLFSEIRASGAVLLVVALYLLGALFRPSWRPTALIVAGVYFGAYGLARVYSGFTTGWPGPEINAAMIAELTIGVLAAGLVLNGRRRHT